MSSIYVINDFGMLLAVPDLSCASLRAVLLNAASQAYLGPGTPVGACSSDPVAVGSSVNLPTYGLMNISALISGIPYDPANPGGSVSTGTSAGTLSVDTPLFNIDSAGGAALSLAILGVWAVGWSVRMAIRALNVDGVRPDGSGD